MTKILVIEDEPMIQDLIHDILSMTDFEIVQAFNGRQGLELVLSCSPDLILCDVMMPEMNGYEVLSQLQRNHKTQSIPFVFLTAKGTKVDVRHGMNLGADDYLIKPFTTGELLQTITTRLKKRATIETASATELQKTKKELDYLLRYDPLTGLPNQLSLREKFNQIIDEYNLPSTITLLSEEGKEKNKESRNLNKLIPIFRLSLDRFRQINSRFGYDHGDQLLKLIAERLEFSLDSSAISRLSQKDEFALLEFTSEMLAESLEHPIAIARLSGDEFAIIFNQVSYRQESKKIAERILKAFTKPFIIYEQEIFIGMSIGIAFYPRDGEILEELLHKANIAMKRAKQRGGNQYEFYNILMQKPLVPDALEFEADLRYALERDELEIYYQPQINLQTGNIIGAEALLRWFHPKRGSVSPTTFIPVAEQTGLIKPISEWFLHQAFKDCKKWQNKGRGILKVSVNLSDILFNQLNLVQWLDEILNNSALNGEYLILELTEGILVENITVSVLKLNSLKALGISIAIDDFGTGYSSLSYLQQFPFDIVKINQSFITNIDSNPKNAGIVQAIIWMAHTLNLQVVAEGVETEAEAVFLRENMCDNIQGFLLSRPIKCSEFHNLIISGQKYNLPSH